MNHTALVKPVSGVASIPNGEGCQPVPKSSASLTARAMVRAHLVTLTSGTATTSSYNLTCACNLHPSPKTATQAGPRVLDAAHSGSSLSSVTELSQELSGLD